MIAIIVILYVVMNTTVIMHCFKSWTISVSLSVARTLWKITEFVETFCDLLQKILVFWHNSAEYKIYSCTDQDSNQVFPAQTPTPHCSTNFTTSTIYLLV